MSSLNDFLTQWQESEPGARQAFSDLLAHLESLTDTTLNFIARPGVSFSLRPRHRDQTRRQLFAMVDVIDDTPDDRWLSVCFYGDMITDPDECGDLIPGGLLGEDGYCFDLTGYDPDMVAYLTDRLTEAFRNAPE